MRKISTSERVREYLLITLGLLIYTLSWTLFLIPHRITGGGASGVAALVYYLTNFPVGYTFLAINAVLIAIGMRILGSGFGVKTIYAVAVAALLFSVEQQLQLAFLPGGLIPGVQNRFLATIIGGGMAGAGVGMAFSQGGSTGGTDILAMIWNKYRGISPGKAILLMDVVIISSAFFVLHDMSLEQRLESIVYGFLVMVITGYTIDAYLTGMKRSLQVMIFSKNYGAIADRITRELHRGATVIDGRGWYSQQETKVLLVVVRKQELTGIYRIVRQEDPEAFTSVASVMGVYGKGFEQIRK
ncbi:MAG: membrane protein [Bacteroidia bacterium]|nr:MAG: membrane protein [Bacteroidia bacterium]